MTKHGEQGALETVTKYLGKCCAESDLSGRLQHEASRRT